MPHTSARLQELLTVLGFLDDIAPSETRAFENRTGELIARSAARRPVSPKVRSVESQGTHRQAYFARRAIPSFREADCQEVHHDISRPLQRPHHESR
jgi:hypothetical protein